MKKRFTAGVALVALIGSMFTPTGCYLSRGAWEEAKILSHRQPIAALVRDPSSNDATRSKLRLVLDAREFAKDRLHLRVKDSFTTYSQLERDTLVLVLSAAYRDALKPYTWWFPIVGRVPYKGYFDFGAAKKAEAELREEGFDTYLRPSDAFSTLGWFNDPLLSTTLNRDSLELANTVIHEVTHNTYYASGQAYFNESFANFVGARGAAEFFRSRGEPEAAAEVDARWEDQKLLASFWAKLIHSLDSAYAAHPSSRTDRLIARDSVYAEARVELIRDVGRQLRTISPAYAQRVPLNNAALLARRIYAQDLSVFDAIYEREGKRLDRTIARIIALAKSNPADPSGALKTWIGSPR